MHLGVDTTGQPEKLSSQVALLSTRTRPLRTPLLTAQLTAIG